MTAQRSGTGDRRSCRCYGGCHATAAKALNRLVVDAILKIQALIRHLDRALLHRGTQFNRWGIAIGGAVAMVVASVYWFSGRASEASQYVQCQRNWTWR